MISEKEFLELYNNDFWKAFISSIYRDIPIPKSEKLKIVKEVYNSIQNARYSPGVPNEEIIRNKGYGVARIIPVFAIQDYCIYYFCIKSLEEILCINRVENTFGGWSLGGQMRKLENQEIENELTFYGRYSFNPDAWRIAFREFNSILFSQLETKKYSFILQFDLSNFYDSIRLDILERRLREKVNENKSWIIALLFFFLNNWNRKNTGLYPQTVGLPQDALADCSRILANFYLQDYDLFAKKIADKVGGLYLRYSDDQMILLNSKEEVEFILLALTKRLDRYGLRVNQKKIHVWTNTELIENRCHDIQKIINNASHYHDVPLIEKFALKLLSIPRKKIKNKWNSGYPLLNKLLYTDLDKIDYKIGKKIYNRLTDKEYLLNSDYKKMGIIFELSKKFSSQKNFIKILESLIESSIHNAFHFECLSFARENKLKDLENKIGNRLQKIESLIKFHF